MRSQETVLFPGNTETPVSRKGSIVSAMGRRSFRKRKDSGVGRPAKDIGNKRTGTLRVRVSPREETQFLLRAARAGREPSEFARALLCAEDSSPAASPPGLSFELTHAVLQTGAELARIADIAERTGTLPGDLQNALARMDAALDKVLAR